MSKELDSRIVLGTSVGTKSQEAALAYRDRQEAKKAAEALLETQLARAAFLSIPGNTEDLMARDDLSSDVIDREQRRQVRTGGLVDLNPPKQLGSNRHSWQVAKYCSKRDNRCGSFVYQNNDSPTGRREHLCYRASIEASCQVFDKRKYQCYDKNIDLQR